MRLRLYSLVLTCALTFALFLALAVFVTAYEESQGNLKIVSEYHLEQGTGSADPGDYYWEHVDAHDRYSRLVIATDKSVTVTSLGGEANRSCIVVWPDSPTNGSGTVNLTLSDVNVDASRPDGGFVDFCAFEVRADRPSVVNLTLSGRNRLISDMYFPGLHVPQEATLYLYGSGSLLSRSGNEAAGYAAGIGGVDGGGSMGKVVMHGGNVSAVSVSGAGIGGGRNQNGNGGNGGTLVMYGGTITAKSYSGAGIGGGKGGKEFRGGSGSQITVYGGAISASSQTGYDIGSGASSTSGLWGSFGTLSMYDPSAEINLMNNGFGPGATPDTNLFLNGGSVSGAGSTLRGTYIQVQSPEQKRPVEQRERIGAEHIRFENGVLTISGTTVSCLGIEYVYVDEELTDSYTAGPEDVVIKLHNSLLRYLEPGEHSIRVEFVGHLAETTFEVGGDSPDDWNMEDDTVDEPEDLMNPNSGGDDSVPARPAGGLLGRLLRGQQSPSDVILVFSIVLLGLVAALFVSIAFPQKRNNQK